MYLKEKELSFQNNFIFDFHTSEVSLNFVNQINIYLEVNIQPKEL